MRINITVHFRTHQRFRRGERVSLPQVCNSYSNDWYLVLYYNDTSMCRYAPPADGKITDTVANFDPTVRAGL